MKYIDMVRNLSKPVEDIHAQLTPYKCGLIHSSMGISGEVAELIQAMEAALKSERKYIDYDPLALPPPPLEFLSVSDLAHSAGISPQKLNRMLVAAGLQYKSSEGWYPTTEAEGLVQIEEIRGYHGEPCRVLRWKPEAVMKALPSQAGSLRLMYV